MAGAGSYLPYNYYIEKFSQKLRYQVVYVEANSVARGGVGGNSPPLAWKVCKIACF